MVVDIEFILIVVIAVNTPTLNTHPSTSSATTIKPPSSSLHHLLFPQHLLALTKCKFALPKCQLVQLRWRRRRRSVVGLVRPVLRWNDGIAIDQISIEGNVTKFLQVIVEGAAAR